MELVFKGINIVLHPDNLFSESKSTNRIQCHLILVKLISQIIHVIFDILLEKIICQGNSRSYVVQNKPNNSMFFLLEFLKSVPSSIISSNKINNNLHAAGK